MASNVGDVTSIPSTSQEAGVAIKAVCETQEAKSKSLITQMEHRRPVGSLGRVPDYRAGGRGFKPRPDQHSGSLNN